MVDEEQAPTTELEVVVAGSGTVVPHPERTCAAYHVRAGALQLLLDCGPGAVHHLARFRLPWATLSHLFISHFHTDHIGDLPALLFALKHGLSEAREAPLYVLGPPGTTALMRRLADAHGAYILDPGFPLHIHELAPGERFPLDDAYALRVAKTPHADESLACRVDGPIASLGYTGDTGPSADLGRSLRTVDLLIAECSLPDALALPAHLSPSSVAELASAASPRELLLSHVYPQLEGEDLPALVRDAGWGGPVRVAHDGLRIPLR